MNEQTNLPARSGLDVRAFSRTLDDTTTANKFLWILGVLKIIESRGDAVIRFRDISREMIDFAIAPIYEFKLNFGGSDRTKEYLDRVFQFNAAADKVPNFFGGDSANSPPDEIGKLLETFVPYRWLTPFFDSSLRGLKDWDKNGRIAELAAAGFKTPSPPPYRFVAVDKRPAVEIHPRWRDYLLSNMAIVRGWVMWNWATFLQDRNPAVPGVINKIQHASPERLMGHQRDFWRNVIKYKGGYTTCLYSKRRITFAECDIDHYIPWSFIGHSHLWNLIPVHKEANRSKGNRLPADKYLPDLARAQCDALATHRRFFSGKFKKLMDSYHADLRLLPSELTDEAALHRAYKKTIPPTIAIASNHQFAAGWSWKK